MRLLVVMGSPPDSSRSVPDPGCFKMYPQPPGPGFPEHAPSVYNSTRGFFDAILRRYQSVVIRESDGGRFVISVKGSAMQSPDHILQRQAQPTRKGRMMSDHVYKTVEITGSSKNSVEEAVTRAVERAAMTVRNMRWFEVVETRGHIEDGKIAHWQVTVKIGFTLEEE